MDQRKSRASGMVVLVPFVAIWLYVLYTELPYAISGVQTTGVAHLLPRGKGGEAEAEVVHVVAERPVRASYSGWHWLRDGETVAVVYLPDSPEVVVAAAPWRRYGPMVGWTIAVVVAGWLSGVFGRSRSRGAVGVVAPDAEPGAADTDQRRLNS